MKRITILFISLLGAFSGFAQNEDVNKYAATITQEDLRGLLTIIASDALEGRETGTRGEKMAAAFIEEEFKRIGLEPVVPEGNGFSYLQKFKLENYAEDGIYLKTGQSTLSLRDNLLYAGKYAMGKPSENTIIYIRAKDVDKISTLKITGKVVLVPVDPDKLAQQKLAAEAYKNGAAMVVMIPFNNEDDFKTYRRGEGRSFTRTRYAFQQQELPGLPKGYFLISPSILAKILGETDALVTDLLQADVSEKTVKSINDKALKITYFTSGPSSTVETENVLGYLEGSDKKDELVVISAHFDHIGKRGDQINNGADDDGSGTSSVLEIAEAFAQAKAEGKGPRRSMLFITVTGEEKGLIGSQYYTSNPVFPLSNTVVDLNIDMIGRHDDAHNDNLSFVYLVGSDRLSSELHELSEKTNNTFTHLSLDYTYNNENHPDRIYYRSDHWNFAKNNVPIIFYFSGVHADYHRPTDTVDKIEFDMLEKRAQLVFYTAWFVANRDDRLVVDKLNQTEVKLNR